jgi:hypothetical protein
MRGKRTGEPGREALPVDGVSAFKDSYSKAIVITDRDGLQKHKLSKRKRKQEYDEMQSLKNEVAELKSMMMEILKSKQG